VLVKTQAVNAFSLCVPHQYTVSSLVHAIKAFQKYSLAQNVAHTTVFSKGFSGVLVHQLVVNQVNSGDSVQ
jgi:hypothetical protein